MRSSSGGLVFFLFYFLLLLVSLKGDSEIQSSSDATSAETTTTTEAAELTTTTISNKCKDLQSSQPIEKVVTCTGTNIKINKAPFILDLSQYRDKDVEQLMTDTETTPSTTRALKSSLLIKESQLTNLKLYLNLDDENLEFTVIFNKNLENIALTGQSAEPVKVTVKGNRKMSEDTINKIKNALKKRTQDSYIQGPGECSPLPSQPTLESFEYLKGCSYFKGDLIIDNKTDIRDPSIEFSEIQGCLMITNTNLTDIKFLNKLKSTNCPKGKENLITGNPNICLFSKRKAELKKLLEVKIENNQKCKDRCTYAWAKENNKTVKCDIIDGDVVIVGVSNVNDLDYLSNVEEIYGRLEVHHNFFTKYTFLPKLQKVQHSTSDAPAIFIHDNYNLTFINLSSLLTLFVRNGKGDILIVQDNNKALAFSEEEVEILERKLGKNIRLPKGSPSQNTQAPGGNSDSTKTPGGSPGGGAGGGSGSKEELEKKEKEAEKKKESNLALGLGLGIGLTALAVIVIAAVVGVIIFLVIRRRKNKKRKVITIDTTKSKSVVVEKKEKKEQKVEKKQAKKEEKYAVCVEKIKHCPKAKPRMVVDDHGNAADVDDFILLESDELLYFDEKHKTVKREGCKMTIANYREEWDFTSKRNQPKPKVPIDKIPKKIFVNKLTYEDYIIKVDHRKLRKLQKQDCNQYEDIERFINVHETCMSHIKYTESVVEKVVNDFIEIYEGKHTTQLVKVQAKDYECRIMGEINGSIWDLLHVLSKDPTYQQHEYVFCGNYMNGSRNDLHTLLFLFACASHYKFTLLRGVNEYGKRAEELVKNTLENYFPDSPPETRDSLKNLILKAFEKLPFAALVNDRALVVHGGISESWYNGVVLDKKDEDNGVTMLDNAFGRLKMPLPEKITPLESKLISDLLYSEPSSVALPMTEYGAGCYFDQIRLNKFLSKMNLDLLVRGRSDTGFDISMNNRLISLSCYFDKDFTKYGAEYVFRVREIYPGVIRQQDKTWPFGVLSLSPIGTITMELYRHSYNEDCLIEVDPNDPKRKKIEEEFETEKENIKEHWRLKLWKLWDEGYTDLNGDWHEGYTALDEKEAKAEEERREDLHSDFMQGWLANMSIEDAIWHYRLLMDDPPEYDAIVLYGYFKYLMEEEFRQRNPMTIHKEDEIKPRNPEAFKDSDILKRVEKNRKEKEDKEKTKQPVIKNNVKKATKRNKKGAKGRKPKKPIAQAPIPPPDVLKSVKIWELKQASWQIVCEIEDQHADGYERAANEFKKGVRKLLLECNGNYMKDRPQCEWTDLKSKDYNTDNYWNGGKKTWDKRGTKEEKDQRWTILRERRYKDNRIIAALKAKNK